MLYLKICLLCCFCLSVISCKEKPESEKKSEVAAKKSYVPDWKLHKLSRYKVVEEIPHDTQAYTQGLFLSRGDWMESTGGYGTSSIRRVEKATGKVLLKKDLEEKFFGEGLAELNGKFYQLTWRSRKGFVYDAKSLEKLSSFSYTGEGWGLATDGKTLIMSDGTERIRFLDSKTFQVLREISVTFGGKPLKMLNELEFIEGEIFANVWQTEQVVRINPVNGQVVGVIDLTGIYPQARQRDSQFVLNGIAYDTEAKKLYVTGKCWPKIYQIELVRVQ